MKKVLFILVSLCLITACSITYKFNGASIDYTKTKTITINNFPIKATLVYPPLGIAFNEGLKDIYTQQTRLNFVKTGGDITLEGEITNYDLTPQAVKENAYASETRLTIGVKVRYSSKSTPDKDFERSFSAYRDFSSTQMLTSVQDQLIEEIVDELTETIFNATVADW
ncbi:MAG: LptE family protein [Bacteroidales bacterium]|nr:LptE family protein [Bacteroidales bacterium]